MQMLAVFGLLIVDALAIMSVGPWITRHNKEWKHRQLKIVLVSVAVCVLESDVFLPIGSAIGGPGIVAILVTSMALCGMVAGVLAAVVVSRT